MSQNDLTTSININAGGNFSRQMRGYEQNWLRFSRTGQRQLSLLQRTASAAGRGLDRLGNRYTAILSGAAGAGTTNFLVSLERRFTRLGIQANVSAEHVDELKKKIFDTARAPDIRIDPSQITAAIEAIVEKTGDLDFAETNLRNIGLAIQATGAEGTNIGEVLAEFQKMGIVLEKDVITALDTLNVQGKEGAFTLQNIAALGPRVVTAYTSMGRTGIPALREMGAALQVIRQGTGSSEQAATAFEALLRTLGDAQKVKMLQQGGIQVFDKEALKQGREELRPINQIMVDIIKRTQGKKTLLSKVFDSEAIRSFNASAAEFNRTGGMASLDKFMNVQADGTTTLQDSARAAHDAAGAMQNLYTAWQQFADSNLTQHIQSLADAVGSIDKETLDRLIKVAAMGALGLGGLVVAKKAHGIGKGLYDFAKGSKSGKAGVAAAMGETAGVQPVYVVNMPGTGLLGGAGGVPAAGKLGNIGKIAKIGLAATGVAGLAVAGYTLLDEYADKRTGRKRNRINYQPPGDASFSDNFEKRSGAKQQRFGRSKLEIEVTDKRVKVKSIDSQDMDVNVDTGPTLAGSL